MDIEVDEDVTKITKILYEDYPEVEMIFICDRRNKVIELRNDGNFLSLNALTSHVYDENHIEITVRGLREDGTIYSPTIGTILQRVKTKDISKNKAREIAKEWIHLNPFIGKSLVEYGLLDKTEEETED